MIPVEFQVLDIPVTFNALLGRPWLHQINGIASTLHQCVKFVQDGELIIIRGDSKTTELDMGKDVAALFEEADLSGIAGADPLMEAPLIDLCEEAPLMAGAVAKDPFGMVDLLTGNDHVSVIEFDEDKEIDPRTFVSTSEMPLRNWISFKGQIASREVMMEKLGLTPRPGVSESKSVPVILSQSSESFVIEFESLDRSDTLTADDHRRVFDSVFPFA